MLHSIISEVQRPVCNQCFDLLWLMTYDPVKALNSFGLEPDSISEHLVFPWRDELRYQRSLVQKDFLQPVFSSEKCKTAEIA